MIKYDREQGLLRVGPWNIDIFCGERLFSIRSWRSYWGWGHPHWHSEDHGVRHLGPILWYKE